MDGAGDLLVDPDLYVIFTDGLDRRFETDIFLFELEFVLLLESFADVLAGDGAEDAAVFPALDFDDDLTALSWEAMMTASSAATLLLNSFAS